MLGVLSFGEIDHDVFPLNQMSIFKNIPGTDNQACWYTAAMMVLSYRAIYLPVVNGAQLQTLFRLHRNKGLQVDEDSKLASEVGLEHSPSDVLFAKKGPSDWFNNLSRLGPLLVSQKNHCLVVRGILNRGGSWKIVLNDPATGRRDERTIDTCNGEIEWFYPIHYRRSIAEPPSILRQPVMTPYTIKY